MRTLPVSLSTSAVATVGPPCFSRSSTATTSLSATVSLRATSISNTAFDTVNAAWSQASSTASTSSVSVALSAVFLAPSAQSTSPSTASVIFVGPMASGSASATSVEMCSSRDCVLPALSTPSLGNSRISSLEARSLSVHGASWGTLSTRTSARGLMNWLPCTNSARPGSRLTSSASAVGSPPLGRSP